MTASFSPVEFLVPANCSCYKSGIEIKSGCSYSFKVIGEWVDFKDDPVNANGNAYPGGIREHLGWAKRSPVAPWMALLVRSKGKNSTSAWRWVHDGASVLTDLPSGILQLCSNDILGFYWNNSRELQVSVTEIPIKR